MNETYIDTTSRVTEDLGLSKVSFSVQYGKSSNGYEYHSYSPVDITMDSIHDDVPRKQ